MDDLDQVLAEIEQLHDRLEVLFASLDSCTSEVERAHLARELDAANAKLDELNAKLDSL